MNNRENPDFSQSHVPLAPEKRPDPIDVSSQKTPIQEPLFRSQPENAIEEARESVKQFHEAHENGMRALSDALKNTRVLPHEHFPDFYRSVRRMFINRRKR